MPFPTNPALEAAVIADAENDLPRLVYADWLDEHGDPARAAFIRTQIALHDKSPADADYPDLVEAHRELVDRLMRRDFLPVGLPFHLEFDSGLFDSDATADEMGLQRGFPFWIEAQTGDEEHAGDAEVAATAMPYLLPQIKKSTTVRGVRYEPEHLPWLYDEPGDGRPFAGDEWAGLHAFEIDRGDERSAVPHVARSPMAKTLRWLRLSVENTADAEALAAADFPHLRRWEAFEGFTCTPAALKKVLAAPWFARLHHFHSHFDGRQAKAHWAGLAALPQLHTLSAWPKVGALAPLRTAGTFGALGRVCLHGAAPDVADLAGLVRAKFPRLAAFEMTHCVLKNTGLAELTAADWWAGLRVLKLHYCPDLTDTAVAAIGQSSAAAGLRSLTVATPKLGNRAFTSLATSYPALTTLTLDTAHTPKADLTGFAAALALPKLRHLHLERWPLRDAGAVALAKNSSVANLTRLDVSYTAVGPQGVKALLRSPHLQRLVYLNLNECKGGSAAEALADPDVMPDLAFCWLPNGVSKRVVAKLQTARPDVFFVG